MEREILFRGKRVDNGEWVHGLLCQYHEGISAKILPNDFGDFYSKMVWVVDPATVGQYTGLTDKNGKKIFEGDIVKNIDGIYVVEYCKSLTRFALVHNGLMSGRPVSYGTIIGNIHDNPELLEGEENAAD